MFRRVASSSFAQNDDNMHRRVISSSPPISDEYIPRTVESIFINYRLRRVGLLRALGTDVGTLYLLCDPDYKEELCLYGYPDGTWDVQEACMVLPPNLPEPPVGINFARDRMSATDWVTLVAEHCDSWLLSLAFFFSVDLSHHDRENLFERINGIPTLAEKVKEYYPGQLIQSRIQEANP